MIDVSGGIHVGDLVAQSLDDIRWQHKQAWLTCGIDKAGWSRSLTGQQPLDLWKLRHLPGGFWRAFFGRFAAAKIKEFWRDEELPYRMAKATIPDEDDLGEPIHFFWWPARRSPRADLVS